ncbi:MAG: 4Fe-4S binding protein, partial [Clostridia bacterium]|nr:4Fe-4S binding protein [Clostridia bacterium]
CPIKVAKVENGKLVIPEDCNNCGVCVGKCPFGAIEGGTVMHKIYIGGRWGKRIRLGTALDKLFTEEEVMKTIEKTILFFKEQGLSGERLSDTVERIGWEKVQEILLSDEILDRKEDILAIETIGGAKC